MLCAHNSSARLQFEYGIPPAIPMTNGIQEEIDASEKASSAFGTGM